MGPSLKVLEFYSGIGGVHYALTYAGVSVHVEAAFEINTSANSVYRHNFPQTTLLQKNIEGLNLEDLEHFNADVWTMSPPCQPYTRLGKQEASCDPRAKSFKKLMNILMKMTSPPSFIFLENVKGFEVSDSCEDFLMILNSKGYYTQSFLLSPIDFGIPNSRLRYYLIARYQKKFNFKTTQKPICLNGNLCECEGLDMECACTALASVVQLYKPMKIKDILNVDNSVSSEINSSSFCEPDLKKMLDLLQKRSFPIKFTKISHSILLRYYSLFDIVDSDSNKSCCFTSGYSRFIEGTGSLFSCLPQSDRNLILNKLSITENDNESNIDLLESLQLRFFSPEEIAALLCFPICFSFPDKITEKQKYKLLGNSVNVLVVANVMRYFLFENKI
uniref:tRNA (Cytosine(38)-C(5))-methyltransferase n=1 Tax=Hydra vulgaris TaxID=6087 RepID=T2MJN0_HYDVU